MSDSGLGRGEDLPWFSFPFPCVTWISSNVISSVYLRLGVFNIWFTCGPHLVSQYLVHFNIW